MLVLDASVSRDAGSDPTRTSILPLAWGCLRSMDWTTASSFALSRPAMAQRTVSEELSEPPAVYRRARYSAARRPVKPEPPYTTRS